MSVEACVSDLQSIGADQSLLLWMLLDRETLRGLEFAQQLTAICSKHGIRRFGSDFRRDVKRILLERDIVQNNGAIVVMAMRKEEAVAKFTAAWSSKHHGVPVQPFCFQTANGKNFQGSVFVVSGHWCDALYLMLRIEKDGFLRYSGVSYPVTQLYEHQVGGEQRIAFVIFDWELLLSAFKGRRTQKQVFVFCILSASELCMWIVFVSNDLF